jgi:hypothetical protein
VNRYLAHLKKDADPAAIFAELKPSRGSASPQPPPAEERAVAVAAAPTPPAAAAAPLAPAPSQCSLTVGARPWAELWIDGRDTHRHTPVVNLPVACGPRQLTLKRADLGIDYQVEEILIPGEPLKRVYKIAPPP